MGHPHSWGWAATTKATANFFLVVNDIELSVPLDKKTKICIFLCINPKHTVPTRNSTIHIKFLWLLLIQNYLILNSVFKKKINPHTTTKYFAIFSETDPGQDPSRVVISATRRFCLQKARVAAEALPCSNRSSRPPGRGFSSVASPWKERFSRCIKRECLGISE